MRKPFLFICFFILTGISFICKGQYTGGSDDGFSSAVYSPSVCAVAVNANIYFGGSSNGSSSATLSASVCAAPVNSNIYFGGVQDGASSAALAVSVCPVPVNANIYFGGVEDGSSSSALAVTTCPIPVNTNIYFGGVQDGSSNGALSVSVCPIPVNTNIYFGGIQDGFSAGVLTVSACPAPVNANIFFGGAQDGFASVYLPTTLTSCLLPIALSYFTGACAGGVRTLTWSTATENNNAGFTIEYSPDGTGWQTIGKLPGAGNSSTPLTYSFTDPVLRTGNAWYRLIQTDLDGKSTYSNLVAVGGCSPGATDKFNVYPNPSAGMLLLSYDGDKTKIQAIEIYNVLGERVYYATAWQPSIDFTEKGAGTYFVHVISDGRTEIRAIVLKRF